MGMWGLGPTENDAAADWIEGMFAATGFEFHVAETLNHSVSDYADEVRIAAHLVRHLTEADLWPHETKEKMRSLAASRLQQMVDERVVTNPALVREIRAEIGALGGQRGIER